MFSHPTLRYPAVIVHGLAHARLAAALGRPFVLLSAPGAAGYAGCLWWRALADAAAAEAPGMVAADVLDCGEAPGWAMAALRVGCRALVLSPACPAWTRVAAAAAALGAIVLPHPPAALDLGRSGAERNLKAWLDGSSGATDRDRTEPFV
jgi:acyl-CoA synthetase (AMP-forming)/AMP-acid ligase II